MVVLGLPLAAAVRWRGVEWVVAQHQLLLVGAPCFFGEGVCEWCVHVWQWDAALMLPVGACWQGAGGWHLFAHVGLRCRKGGCKGWPGCTLLAGQPLVVWQQLGAATASSVWCVCVCGRCSVCRRGGRWWRWCWEGVCLA
jgi:hypothetical protein